MEIKLYLQMLQKNWWFIILTALIALTTSLTLSYISIPQYSSVARFIIVPSGTLTDGADVVRSLDTLDRRSVVATYAEVMNSSRIFEGAASFLGVDSLELAKSYTVTAVDLPDSSVLELTVSGPDPLLASQLANAIGIQSISFTRSLNLIYELNILDTAVPAEVPFSPVPLRDAMVATALGFMGGVILAVLGEQIRIPIDAYRNRLRTDNATGLYNASYFRQLLRGQVTQQPDDILTIGIVGLSGLSEYLTTLPSAGVQSLLVNVTETFQKELRGNDVVARWDETSFIVMLPSTDGSAANSTFFRIYKALTQPIILSTYGVSVNLTPCIGGAVYSNKLSSEELLEMANDALEKSQGNNGAKINIWEMKNPFWSQPQNER